MRFNRLTTRYPLLSSLLWLGLEFAAFSIFHPWGARPALDVAFTAFFAALAVAAVLRRAWLHWLPVLGGLALLGAVLLDALARNEPAWVILLGASGVFFLLGVWSHRRWLSRRWRYDEPDDVLAGAPTSLAGWIHAVRPRSATACWQALGCVGVALSLLSLFGELDLLHAAAALSVPLLILAVAFWFHGTWIRWYGPLVCLGLAGLCVWVCVELGLPTNHPAYLVLALLVVCAIKMRNWEFDQLRRPAAAPWCQGQEMASRAL